MENKDYRQKLEVVSSIIQEFLLTENDMIVDCFGLQSPKYIDGVENLTLTLIDLLSEIYHENKYVIKKIKRQKIAKNIQKKVMERDKYRCINCNSYKNLQIDHIKPFADGGSNDIGNLRVLCGYCNLSKGKKASLKTY